MRICSLLPSATEIVFALGLGQDLVGVSHTCDFPAQAQGLPVLTQSLRNPANGSSATPVHGVSEEGATSGPVFALDGDLLRKLRPDLVLTQDICDVCAIGSNTVFEVAAKTLGYTPRFLTIRAAKLRDILCNIMDIGQAAGAEEEARGLVDSLQKRIEEVRACAGANRRVLCVEWAKPLRAAGLWTAECIELAGGVHGLVEPGERSRRVLWEEVATFAPQVILIMPCGYDLARSGMELASLSAEPAWSSLPAVQSGEVYVFDGRAPSRHGPRVVDVLEAFAEIVNPERFAPRWRGSLYQQAA